MDCTDKMSEDISIFAAMTIITIINAMYRFLLATVHDIFHLFGVKSEYIQQWIIVGGMAMYCSIGSIFIYISGAGVLGYLILMILLTVMNITLIVLTALSKET